MKNKNLYIFFISLLAILGTQSGAWASSLLVQPMTLSLQGQPGSTITGTLEVRNSSSQKTLTVEAVSTDLLQTPEGHWGIAPNENHTAAHSCLSWLDALPATMEIPPATTSKINLSLNVPRNARGSYFAALLVRDMPQENKKISVVMQFLVPVFVTVGNAQAGPKLTVKELGLSEGQDKDGKTILSTWGQVHNGGSSLVRLGGNIDIFSEQEGRWRRIHSVEINPRQILPGATVTRSGELNRRLPAGKYKLRSRLTMDDRSLRPMETLYQYTPQESEAAGQKTSLFEISPEIVTVKTSPGSQRSTVFSIFNSGLAPIDVTFKPMRHKGLSDKSAGRYDCSEWIDIVPEKVSVLPGRNRSVRLVLTQPKEPTAIPYHYGTVTATASTKGKPTSARNMLVVSEKVRQKGASQIVVSKSNITRKHGSLCTFVSLVANEGTKHGSFGSKARIVDASGLKVVKKLNQVETNRLLLPGEKTLVSFNIDVAGIADGIYSIEFTAISNDKEAISALPVRIQNGMVTSVFVKTEEK